MTTRVPLVIAADHPAFAGHFPGAPIVPGVVLLDEALHALETTLGWLQAGRELQSVKFRQVLRPGEPLELRYEPPAAGTLHFSLWSGDSLIAEATLKAMPLTSETGHGR